MSKVHEEGKQGHGWAARPMPHNHSQLDQPIKLPAQAAIRPEWQQQTWTGSRTEQTSQVIHTQPYSLA